MSSILAHIQPKNKAQEIINLAIDAQTHKQIFRSLQSFFLWGGGGHTYTSPQITIQSFTKNLFNKVKSVLLVFKEPEKEDVQTILHTQQNYLYLDIIRGCVFWHGKEVNMVQSQVQSQLNSHKEIMSK